MEGGRLNRIRRFLACKRKAQAEVTNKNTPGAGLSGVFLYLVGGTGFGFFVPRRRLCLLAGP